MLNLDRFVRFVLWISLGLLAIDFLLVISILRRRLSRWMYFNRKDAATKRFRAEIHRLVVGELSPAGLAATLPSRPSIPARVAIRDLLLEGLGGDGRKAVTEVLFRLGYIARWSQEAFGRRRANELIEHIVAQKNLPPARRLGFTKIRRLRLFSIKRAQAVKDLASLDQPFAKVFVQEALSDPSPYVACANVAAMGLNPQEYELPILLDLLRNAIRGSNDLAMVPLKNALVRYPIIYLDQFVLFLYDSNPLFRFAIVDCIRQMCDAACSTLSANDFPERLYWWFVDRAPQDKSVEVRARSARVIRHFHDAAAVVSLRALLRDESEFVRLHTVRACADPYYSELIGDIARCITDQRWRVREASAKTLAAFGDAGKRQMAQYFLDTSDQFACEQMVEQMERSGIIFEMLPALGSEERDQTLTGNVFAKMVGMGRTALLTDLLKTRISIPSNHSISANVLFADGNEKARERLLALLLAAPTPELTIVLYSLAADKEDPLTGRAQSVVECLDSSISLVARKGNPCVSCLRGWSTTPILSF